MDCNSAREKMSCYMDGMLDEECLELIEEHLGRCAECRCELAALRAVTNMLCETESLEPPADLRSSISQAVEASQRMSLSCDSAVELLSAYLDGELSEKDNRVVADHLKSCVFCSDDLAVLVAIREASRCIEPIAPPAGLRERIKSTVTDRRAPVWYRVLLGVTKLPWRPAASVGLGAVVLGLFCLTLNSLDREQPLPTPVVSQKQVHSAPRATARSEPKTTVAVAKAPLTSEPVIVAQETRRYELRKVGRVRRIETTASITTPVVKTPRAKKTFDVTAESDKLAEESSVDLAQEEPESEPEEISTPEPVSTPDDNNKPNVTDKESLLRVAAAGIADDHRTQELLNQAKAEAALRKASRSRGISLVSIKF